MLFRFNLSLFGPRRVDYLVLNSQDNAILCITHTSRVTGVISDMCDAIAPNLMGGGAYFQEDIVYTSAPDIHTLLETSMHPLIWKNPPIP